MEFYLLTVKHRTPLVGLGCESGSYLLFAIISTVAWSLLVISAYLSHTYSLSAMAYELPLSSTDDTRQIPDRNQHSRSSQPTTEQPPVILALAIVLTRITGMVLASGNAAWLLLLSLLQFTKMYKNCWCWADVIQYGTGSWVPIWATSDQIFQEALTSWIAGVVLCAVTVVFAALFFIIMPSGDFAKEK